MLAALGVAAAGVFMLPAAANASTTHNGPPVCQSQNGPGCGNNGNGNGNGNNCKYNDDWQKCSPPKPVCVTEYKWVKHIEVTWRHGWPVDKTVWVKEPVKVCSYPGGNQGGNPGGSPGGNQGGSNGCTQVTFNVSSTGTDLVTEASGGPTVHNGEEVFYTPTSTDYYVYDVQHNGGTTTFELTTTQNDGGTLHLEGNDSDWQLTAVCP